MIHCTYCQEHKELFLPKEQCFDWTYMNRTLSVGPQLVPRTLNIYIHTLRKTIIVIVKTKSKIILKKHSSMVPAFFATAMTATK